MAIGRLPAARGGEAGSTRAPYVSGSGAALVSGSPAADRLTLSGRLAAGNKLALRHAGGQVRAFAAHPLRALGAAAGAIAGSMLHPVQAAGTVAAAFTRDPVDGLIQGAHLGSLWLAVGSVGVLGTSFALAPFTAGASLAWLPLAGSLGAAAAAGGAGALGVSLAKNEVDIARARTAADLDEQARELGNDVLNAGLLAAAGGAGKAFRSAYTGSRFARKVNPASLKRVSGRANAGLWAQVSRRLGIRPAAAGPAPVLKSQAAMKARAAFEVQRYLDGNPLGRRTVRDVADLSGPAKSAAKAPGNLRLAYHGTQEKFAAGIRKGGLKPSDIGDYGSGIYLGNKPEVAINYADDAYIAHPGPGDGIVYSVEFAPGRVLDFLAKKKAFEAWAKARFNPADASDAVNRLYTGSRTSVSPIVDVRWTRYINRYMAEKGYDSALIRNRDALRADYWMVPDPARVRLLQEFRFAQPTNRSALANGFLGAFAPLMRLRAALPLLRPNPATSRADSR